MSSMPCSCSGTSEQDRCNFVGSALAYYACRFARAGMMQEHTRVLPNMQAIAADCIHSHLVVCTVDVFLLTGMADMQSS